MDLLKVRAMGTISNFRQFLFFVDLVQVLQVSKNRQPQVSHAELEGNRMQDFFRIYTG